MNKLCKNCRYCYKEYNDDIFNDYYCLLYPYREDFVVGNIYYKSCVSINTIGNCKDYEESLSFIKFIKLIFTKIFK